MIPHRRLWRPQVPRGKGSRRRRKRMHLMSCWITPNYVGHLVMHHHPLPSLRLLLLMDGLAGMIMKLMDKILTIQIYGEWVYLFICHLHFCAHLISFISIHTYLCQHCTIVSYPVVSRLLWISLRVVGRTLKSLLGF